MFTTKARAIQGVWFGLELKVALEAVNPELSPLLDLPADLIPIFKPLPAVRVARIERP